MASGQILDREARSARTAKLPNPIKEQIRRRDVPMIPNDVFGARRMVDIGQPWTATVFTRNPRRY
jgi:hypothetical protein